MELRSQRERSYLSEPNYLHRDSPQAGDGGFAEVVFDVERHGEGVAVADGDFAERERVAESLLADRAGGAGRDYCGWALVFEESERGADVRSLEITRAGDWAGVFVFG